MMKQERRSEQTNTHLFPSEQVGVAAEAIDQQIQRIRRIGKRIFSVADCIVAIDDKLSGKDIDAVLIDWLTGIGFGIAIIGTSVRNYYRIKNQS